MSADRWTVCPKCHEEWLNKVMKFRDYVNGSYGKVSQEEFLKLSIQLHDMQQADEEETLREDFGQGIRAGIYYLEYSAYCQKCGWGYEKHIEEVVYYEQS